MRSSGWPAESQSPRVVDDRCSGDAPARSRNVSGDGASSASAVAGCISLMTHSLSLPFTSTTCRSSDAASPAASCESPDSPKSKIADMVVAISARGSGSSVGGRTTIAISTCVEPCAAAGPASGIESANSNATVTHTGTDRENLGMMMPRNLAGQPSKEDYERGPDSMCILSGINRIVPRYIPQILYALYAA
jgi:hypothetical protein